MAYTTRTDGKPIVHWTEELFLEHADVWLEIHERTWLLGEEQARDLEAILAPHEARALLESAGWSVTGVFGGWEREPVAAERRKLIFVARPAARH